MFRNYVLISPRSAQYVSGRLSPIFFDMTKPFAHNPDCDFWYDHYESECTCRASASRPVADPAQDLRAIWAEIAELRKRSEQIEATIASLSGYR
jgi:hypothetical protein